MDIYLILSTVHRYLTDLLRRFYQWVALRSLSMEPIRRRIRPTPASASASNPPGIRWGKMNPHVSHHTDSDIMMTDATSEVSGGDSIGVTTSTSSTASSLLNHPPPTGDRNSHTIIDIPTTPTPNITMDGDVISASGGPSWLHPLTASVVSFSSTLAAINASDTSAVTSTTITQPKRKRNSRLQIDDILECWAYLSDMYQCFESSSNATGSIASSIDLGLRGYLDQLDAAFHLLNETSLENLRERLDSNVTQGLCQLFTRLKSVDQTKLKPILEKLGIGYMSRSAVHESKLNESTPIMQTSDHSAAMSQPVKVEPPTTEDVLTPSMNSTATVDDVDIDPPSKTKRTRQRRHIKDLSDAEQDAALDIISTLPIARVKHEIGVHLNQPIPTFASEISTSSTHDDADIEKWAQQEMTNTVNELTSPTNPMNTDTSARSNSDMSDVMPPLESTSTVESTEEEDLEWYDYIVEQDTQPFHLPLPSPTLDLTHNNGWSAPFLSGLEMTSFMKRPIQQPQPPQPPSWTSLSEFPPLPSSSQPLSVPTPSVPSIFAAPATTARGSPLQEGALVTTITKPVRDDAPVAVRRPSSSQQHREPHSSNSTESKRPRAFSSLPLPDDSNGQIKLEAYSAASGFFQPSVTGVLHSTLTTISPSDSEATRQAKSFIQLLNGFPEKSFEEQRSTRGAAPIRRVLKICPSIDQTLRANLLSKLIELIDAMVVDQLKVIANMTLTLLDDGITLAQGVQGDDGIELPSVLHVVEKIISFHRRDPDFDQHRGTILSHQIEPIILNLLTHPYQPVQHQALRICYVMCRLRTPRSDLLRLGLISMKYLAHFLAPTGRRHPKDDERRVLDVLEAIYEARRYCTPEFLSVDVAIPFLLHCIEMTGPSMHRLYAVGILVHLLNFESVLSSIDIDWIKMIDVTSGLLFATEAMSSHLIVEINSSLVAFFLACLNHHCIHPKKSQYGQDQIHHFPRMVQRLIEDDIVARLQDLESARVPDYTPRIRYFLPEVTRRCIHELLRCHLLPYCPSMTNTATTPPPPSALAPISLTAQFELSTLTSTIHETSQRTQMADCQGHQMDLSYSTGRRGSGGWFENFLPRLGPASLASLGQKAINRWNKKRY